MHGGELDEADAVEEPMLELALDRTIGWVSQWKEMIEAPNQRIGRPRQRYTGTAIRDDVPIDRRRCPTTNATWPLALNGWCSGWDGTPEYSDARPGRSPHG